jgi:cytoskeleton protein RodZ
MTDAATVPGLVQIGETLRAAREVRGLSPDQAAARLRCDVRVIEALEAGRFADVGPPVFARGHLLRYAELLGEPGDAMVAAWAQVAGSTAAGELMADTHPRPVRDLRQVRRRLVAGTAILCATIVAAWSLQQFGTPTRRPDARAAAETVASSAVAGPRRAALEQPPGSASSPSSTLAQAQPPAPVEQQARASVPDPSLTPSSAAPAPAGARAANARLATATPPAARPSARDVLAPPAPAASGRDATNAAAQTGSSARLAVTASEESWLEVYDRRNRRLFFGVARPGALVDVRGNLPLRVVVGNVPATTFEVDGRRVEVPREAMRGRRAATFRVGPDGRLSAWPRA